MMKHTFDEIPAGFDPTDPKPRRRKRNFDPGLWVVRVGFVVMVIGFPICMLAMSGDFEYVMNRVKSVFETPAKVTIDAELQDVSPSQPLANKVQDAAIPRDIAPAQVPAEFVHGQYSVKPSLEITDTATNRTYQIYDTADIETYLQLRKDGNDRAMRAFLESRATLKPEAEFR